MNTQGTEWFHRIYGKTNKRVAYRPKDFLDYALMCAVCALVIHVVYGASSPVGAVGIVLCAAALVMFPVRNGWAPGVPIVLRRPQEVLYSIVYKLLNLKRWYFAALAVLLLESWLISITPTWPHHVELMRTIAFWLFYLHLGAITAYRTWILVVHLQRRETVREILMQTAWKRKLEEQPNIVLEILHAYATGLLAHILLIAPWFLVITWLDFSVLFLAATCVLNVYVHVRFLKVINAWFYRDHWLAHNSEFEFVYLHGPHHDAIPSGLIGVAGNGHLEGVLRHSIGAPAPFFNPFIAALVYSFEVQGDIEAHQFIPGMYPKANLDYQKITQHSLHHFGMLEPYGFGLNIAQPDANPEFTARFKVLPEELKNGIRLDEALTGYRWANPKHAQYLDLVRRYEGPTQASTAESAPSKQASDDTHASNRITEDA